jgi:hypothetical protein
MAGKFIATMGWEWLPVLDKDQVFTFFAAAKRAEIKGD